MANWNASIPQVEGAASTKVNNSKEMKRERKPPDSLKKLFSFMSYWVRIHFINFVKCCVQQILNYLGPLVNSANVIHQICICILYFFCIKKNVSVQICPCVAVKRDLSLQCSSNTWLINHRRFGLASRSKKDVISCGHSLSLNCCSPRPRFRGCCSPLGTSTSRAHEYTTWHSDLVLRSSCPHVCLCSWGGGRATFLRGQPALVPTAGSRTCLGGGTRGG